MSTENLEALEPAAGTELVFGDAIGALSLLEKSGWEHPATAITPKQAQRRTIGFFIV